MKARNIDTLAELGKLLIKNNRRDDLSITETTKLLQTAGAENGDRILNAIATAFYMGYAAGYKRGDSSRVIKAGEYHNKRQAETAAANF